MLDSDVLFHFRLRPAGARPLDDQEPTTNRQAGVRVGHENLLGRADVRHLH